MTANQGLSLKPLLLQHIIHVRHIRGNVHGGILSFVLCHYPFSHFLICHNLNLIEAALLAVNIHLCVLC